MTTYVYSIPKISCGHCVAAITNELQEIEGVRQVTGAPQTKTITVQAQGPAKEELIKSKLAQIGYPAEP
jgi:copper chaperone CopZ